MIENWQQDGAEVAVGPGGSVSMGGQSVPQANWQPLADGQMMVKWDGFFSGTRQRAARTAILIFSPGTEGQGGGSFRGQVAFADGTVRPMPALAPPARARARE